MKKARISTRTLRLLLKNAETLQLSGSAKLRLAWFLFAAKHKWNVSKTCRHFGIATTTFTRWARRFDPHDSASLEQRPRHAKLPSGLNENSKVVAYIECCRQENPYASNNSIRQYLQEKHGLHISNATVGRIIQRHGFFFGSTPAHCTKRQQYIESTHTDPSSLPTIPLKSKSPEEGDVPFFGAAPALSA